MYLGFYGLDKEPFHITPDPEFLYLSPSHKEAFATVTYGIDQRKGFVVLTGEVGTGKTTILRAYLERLNRTETECLYLFNPNLSFEELLKALLLELGQAADVGSESSMLQTLQWILVERYKARRNVAIVIDEAQNMPVETLERLRMLSNIETPKEKLVQIVLVGQPELDKKLDLHSLRQLKQRIALRANILPLTREESAAYVKHRLQHTGAHPEDVFPPPVLAEIVRYGQGIPRMLNVVCSNALIAGFGSRCRPITKKLVRQVIADLRSEPGRRGRKWKPLAVPAVLAAAIIAGGIAYMDLVPRGAPGAPATPPPRPPVEVVQAPPELPPSSEVKEELSTKSLEDLAAQAAAEAVPVVVNAVEPQQQATPDSLTETVPEAQAQPDEVKTESEAAPPKEKEEPAPETPAPQTEAQEPPETAPPRAEETSAPEAPPPQIEAEKQPEVEALSSPVEDTAPADVKAFPVTRVVKRGDYLLKMIREVYGKGNDDLLQLVRANNASLGKTDTIQPGDTIVFPAPPSE